MRHLLLTALLVCNLAWAESRRIEVYPLSQNYWDTKAGDTLGEIVDTLLPENRYLQEKLMRDIVSLNPGVFPNGDPHYMLANKRLWLPNAVKAPDTTSDPDDYTIETYQWGSIKTRK
jgi:Tfp pilus assembly protein FimV